MNKKMGHIMSGAEISSLVISIISVIVSATMSILIYIWSKKNTSTDYLVKDEVIRDLVNLEGNLNSICIKSATHHMMNNFNIEKEIDFINHFLKSSTMSFIMSYDDSEADRLFYLNLLLITDNSKNINGVAKLAKNCLDMLHNICKIDLIGKLKNASSAECLKLITNSKEQVNWLLQSTNKNVEKTESTRQKIVRKQLEHIKSKGVEDPYIELFLLLSGENPESDENLIKMQNLMSLCEQQYGRLNVTDSEILSKYKDFLVDFEYKE